LTNEKLHSGCKFQAFELHISIFIITNLIKCNKFS